MPREQVREWLRSVFLANTVVHTGMGSTQIRVTEECAGTVGECLAFARGSSKRTRVNEHAGHVQVKE